MDKYRRTGGDRDVAAPQNNPLQKRKSKPKKRTGLFMVLFLIVILGLFLAAMYAPYFNITEVYCEGNLKLTSDEIITVSDIVLGENIFRMNLNGAKERVASIPYVSESNIRRVYPNKIKIWVRESVPAALFAIGDQIVVIDENGKAIETVVDSNTYNIPVIHGFKTESYELGKKINLENEKQFKIAIECVAEIVHKELLDNIASIDVSDINDITLNFEDRITIKLGNGAQLAYKMNFLKQIINEQISQYQQGVLDFTGENAYFK